MQVGAGNYKKKSMKPINIFNYSLFTLNISYRSICMSLKAFLIYNLVNYHCHEVNNNRYKSPTHTTRVIKTIAILILYALKCTNSHIIIIIIINHHHHQHLDYIYVHRNLFVPIDVRITTRHNS